MARIILDPTTPRELLWRNALDLVAELTGSITSAKALLIFYLPENIRLRFALMDGYRSPGFPAKSAPDAQGREPPEDMQVRWVNRDPTPHDQRFWHPDEAVGERLITYDEDSSFRWSGPPQWLPLPGFKPPPTDFTVTLLWLDRDDIIKVLRFVGLLPPVDVPAAREATSQPSSPPPPPPSPLADLLSLPPNAPCKLWIAKAVMAYPQQKDESNPEYTTRLWRDIANKRWTRKTVKERLRELRVGQRSHPRRVPPKRPPKRPPKNHPNHPKV